MSKNILDGLSEKSAAVLYVCEQAELYRPERMCTYEQLHRLIVVDYRLLSAALYQKLVPITEDNMIHRWNINRTGLIPVLAFGEVPKKQMLLRDYFVRSEGHDLCPGLEDVKCLEKQGFVESCGMIKSSFDAEQSFQIKVTEKAKAWMPLELVLELDNGYIEDHAARVRILNELKQKLKVG